MACLCGGGKTTQGGTSNTAQNNTTTQSQSGTQDQTGTQTQTGTQSGTQDGSQRAYLPPELLAALKNYGINIGDTGLNSTQTGALSGINGNAAPLGAANNAAITTGANAVSTSQGALDYLKAQQGNGSFTLGKYFGAAPTIAGASALAPSTVVAGRGADYAGSYATPLQGAYTDAALNDYDTGVDRGFNALRAGNADAFGNKRTGVAEGIFQSDAARGRGNLSANLNLNAFNTAAGMGQTDADRAMGASTTNANLGQSNNQFNANLAQSANMFNSNLIDSRQKSDISSAQIGEASRLGTANNILNGASSLAGIGATNMGNATNFNSASLQSQLAAAGLGNISASQLAQLAQLWGVGAGSNSTGSSTGTSTANGTSTSNGTFNSTGTGTQNGTSSTNSTGFTSSPGNLFGTLGGLAIGAGSMGWKPFG